MTLRFLEATETNYIKYIFDRNPNMLGVDLAKSEIESFVENTTYNMINNHLKVAMLFDEQNNPKAFCTGFELPKVAGWYKALSKSIETASYYSITAQMMAPVEDFLISYMESKGYFKYWCSSPENSQRARIRILHKYSKVIPRYDWFDELIIPPGLRSGIPVYDRYRRLNTVSNTICRMYVLRQEFREQLIPSRTAKCFVPQPPKNKDPANLFPSLDNIV